MNLQMSNYTGYEQFNFIRNVSTYERDPRNIQMDGRTSLVGCCHFLNVLDIFFFNILKFMDHFQILHRFWDCFLLKSKEHATRAKHMHTYTKNTFNIS